MSEDNDLKDKEQAKKAKPEPAKPAPKQDKRPIEQWEKDDPIEHINARIVLAHKKWGANKELTQSEWRAAAKEVLETPIGFKN